MSLQNRLIVPRTKSVARYSRTLVSALVTVTALCLLSGLVATQAVAGLEQDLVAYWNFDGSGEDAYQATFGGPGFNATHPNGATPDAPGRFGSSILFTRALGQYLEVDSPVITSGQDHTYSAWYRATFSTIEGADFESRYFIMESTGPGGDSAYAISYGLRDIQGDGYDDRGQVHTQWLGDTANGDFDQPDLSQWHNIIVTYDAGAEEHRAYLDGAHVLTMASHDPLSDVAGLIIGGHRDGTGRNWDGWIDDVAFWSRVLTVDEIAEIQTGPVIRSFVDMEVGLTGIYLGSATWSDYDNDADLDILLSGHVGFGDFSGMYRNDDGVFVEFENLLPALDYVSATWGDYDNDGDLDVFMAGWSYADQDRVTAVFRNDGGTFVDSGAIFELVSGSTAAWGDYDNDGDLDLLYAGTNSDSDPVTRLYENDGGSFTLHDAGLADISNGSVAWGDYDNDGDLDILMAGSDIAKVYQNEMGVFEDLEAGLPGVHHASAAWGDYDADGDLDILLTGGDIAQVYENDAGTFTDIETGLQGVSSSSVAWGDYDNDGDLDILLTGNSGTTYYSLVYRNNDGIFEDIGAGLPGVRLSSVAWGDYDNDGRLDILIAGSAESSKIARVYRNLTPIANSQPQAPTNLRVLVDDSILTFHWDHGWDEETPTIGCTYNLRVGTTPGGREICSAMADGEGYRLLPAYGNTNHNPSWAIQLPEPMTLPLYWSVQTVDGAFAGSLFADEQIFDGVSGVVGDALPSSFALRHNVPNPFNPMTMIGYDLPFAESVNLRVFDVSGRLVRVLLRERGMQAGFHEVPWNGRDDTGRTVAAGVYLYSLEAGAYRETRRMVLIR